MINYKAWHIIFLHMFGVTMDSERVYGFHSSKFSLGVSVAKASDARVSMTIFTYNISIAINGLFLRTIAPKRDIKRATILTVS